MGIKRSRSKKAPPVIAKPKPLVTYLGPGPLSGEYRFKEIPGSVAAENEDVAIEKAIDWVNKNPNLVQK